jgi:hypothetical protein
MLRVTYASAAITNARGPFYIRGHQALVQTPFWWCLS